MTEFDAYGERYRAEIEQALPFGAMDLDRFTAAKADRLVELAGRWLEPPAGLTVLDVGCGTGETDRFLEGRFGSLHGADISNAQLDRARETNPAVEYRHHEPGRLPYEDAAFDLTFCINVVHHVPPPDWPGFVAEMARVTRRNGIVAVFEHNPLNPVTRRVVSRCSFDEDAMLLRRRRTEQLLTGAGLLVAEGAYILFLPIAKRWARAVEWPLRWVPLGAQYYVAGRVA
jgi:ubiquinone/menaquinone biosynthesis C-methylase UbiE